MRDELVLDGQIGDVPVTVSTNLSPGVELDYREVRRLVAFGVCLWDIADVVGVDIEEVRGNLD